MTKILLDQGLPRSSAKTLHDKGWDVLHTGDTGLSRATDRQLLDYARKEDRVIITLDSDFHAILATENARSPSVIRIRREDLKGQNLADLIMEVFPQIQDVLKKGAMVSITEKAIRIREIPLID